MPNVTFVRSQLHQSVQYGPSRKGCSHLAGVRSMTPYHHDQGWLANNFNRACDSPPPPSQIYTTFFSVEKSVSIQNADVGPLPSAGAQRSGRILSPRFTRVSSFPSLCRPPVTPLRSALISHRCACISVHAGARNHCVLKGRSTLLWATRRHRRPLLLPMDGHAHMLTRGLCTQVKSVSRVQHNRPAICSWHAGELIQSPQ